MTPVILHLMKTAISLPDEVFEAAEQLADELGLSRSGLYARAVADFVEQQRGENVTARLNEVYAEVESTLDPLLARLQSASLPNDEW